MENENDEIFFKIAEISDSINSISLRQDDFFREFLEKFNVLIKEIKEQTSYLIDIKFSLDSLEQEARNSSQSLYQIANHFIPQDPDQY